MRTSLSYGALGLAMLENPWRCWRMKWWGDGFVLFPEENNARVARHLQTPRWAQLPARLGRAPCPGAHTPHFQRVGAMPRPDPRPLGGLWLGEGTTPPAAPLPPQRPSRRGLRGGGRAPSRRGPGGAEARGGWGRRGPPPVAEARRRRALRSRAVHCGGRADPRPFHTAAPRPAKQRQRRQRQQPAAQPRHGQGGSAASGGDGADDREGGRQGSRRGQRHRQPAGSGHQGDESRGAVRLRGAQQAPRVQESHAGAAGRGAEDPRESLVQYHLLRRLCVCVWVGGGREDGAQHLVPSRLLLPLGCLVLSLVWCCPMVVRCCPLVDAATCFPPGNPASVTIVLIRSLCNSGAGVEDNLRGLIPHPADTWLAGCWDPERSFPRRLFFFSSP